MNHGHINTLQGFFHFNNWQKEKHLHMWEKLIFPLKFFLKTDHLSHDLLIHYTVDTECIPYSQLNLLTTYIHPHTNKPYFIKKNKQTKKH